MTYKQLHSCRICGSKVLNKVLDLGEQALTGVFPRTSAEQVEVGPLVLVWCEDCGLVQLAHSFDPDTMYGSNYGYRSGLNPTMVRHLQRKVGWLEKSFPLNAGDAVVDIGSNDGTLLNSYTVSGLNRVGFDPVASKYLDHYDSAVKVVTDFFSADALRNSSLPPISIATSIAMFYDLEDPNGFVALIAGALAPEGIWHFEQSYLPAMLRTGSYDTVCHEHLEYYSLTVVRDLLLRHGLKLIDVQTNSVNGGSFAVTAALDGSSHQPNTPVIDWLLSQEEAMGLDTLQPYEAFARRVLQHRRDLVGLIQSLRAADKKVVGYGASTKGNVLLQFCGFSTDELTGIAEVNEEKFGAFTPGTVIPISSESAIKSLKPDYMLILPWHFRDFIVERESEFLNSGGKLIFPLPEIEIVA